MKFSAFLLHVGYGTALSVLSFALTWLLMKRVRILDTPNERSSHTQPTPRSGGIAIVITFFVGLAGIKLLSGNLVLEQSFFRVFSGAAFLIAAVSLFDDLTGIGFKAKLGLQSVASIAVMVFGVVIDHVSVPGLGGVTLGWWGYPLTFVWIVGLTNAFNFMDGIDGLAAGTAIVAGAFFAAITFLGGSGFMYLVSSLIAWSCLGFLILNWQPARIFMGDTGSQFLGFVFAVLAVMAGTLDAAHISYFVMPLLFFHFLWDTAFTLVRRLRAGEPVIQAHRTHLYQLLNRMGFSHAQVTRLYLGVGVMQGIGALVLTNTDIFFEQVLVFLPFVVFQIWLSVAVTRQARLRGLIA